MNYIYDIYNGTGANVCPSCTGGESDRMGERYAVRVADSVGGTCSKCKDVEQIGVTVNTKVGDTVTSGYGEQGIVRGETNGGRWWIVENVKSGRVTPVKKMTTDTVVIVGQPIENGGN